jgi:hypothetical protein
VPQLDTQKNLFGEIWVDTLREIVVNKVGTLIGRCEIKDLVDLYFLKAEGFDAIDLLPDAQRKEGGLEPAMLAYLLSELSVESRLPPQAPGTLRVSRIHRRPRNEAESTRISGQRFKVDPFNRKRDMPFIQLH